MLAAAVLGCPSMVFASRPYLRRWNLGDGSPRFRVFCSQNPVEEVNRGYKPGFVDDLLLEFFRKKMVEEVGWNSEKLCYDGLIEVANRLMMKSGNSLIAEQSATFFKDHMGVSLYMEPKFSDYSCQLLFLPEY